MKFTKTILLCTVIGIVASACARFDSIKEYLEEQETPIGFDTYAQRTKAYSRGDISSNEEFNVNGYQFGVNGYYNSKIYLGNETAGAEQKFDGVVWQYAKSNEIRFWPTTGTVDFYAYFPFGTGVTMAKTYAAGQPVMTLTNWTDGADVMYSVATEKTKAEKTALQFKHVFTEIKQVNVKLDPSHPYSNIALKIGGVTLTNTHCENDAKIKVYKDGSHVIENGATQKQRRYTFTEMTIDKEHPGSIISSSNYAYLFPVASEQVWDGTKSSGIAETKTCLKIKLKVSCGDVYILGTESEYVDVYVPLKTAIGQNLSLERAKRYVFNVNFKNGFGYNKDGDPIVEETTQMAFSIDNTEAWGDVSVNVTI